jgi:aspartate aminotransferase
VGWSMGPKFLIDKMKAILTHVGAWAPKPEQMASARYLSDLPKYDAFLVQQKEKVNARLNGFYAGLMKLKKEGFGVDAISPQAAIYLTVKFTLKGKKTSDGKTLETTADVTRYLLDEAKIAIVPFFAFGADQNSDWYRLSVGTCKLSDVDDAVASLKAALEKLK